MIIVIKITTRKRTHRTRMHINGVCIKCTQCLTNPKIFVCKVIICFLRGSKGIIYIHADKR